MPSRVTANSARGAFPLSSFQTTPLTQVRFLYSAFVKVLFSTLPPGTMHWQDDEATEIVVSDEHPISETNIGTRPCVSFTRGPIQFYSLGMDDMLDFDPTTGKETKSVLIPGVMSINCCSRVDLESEQMAWFISEHLWILRKKLMGINGFFEIGRQQQVSAPSSAEGVINGDNAKEWFCTTVTSPFQFPRKSQATPLNNAIVNEIALMVTTQRQRQMSCSGQGLGPAASPNADLPQNIRIEAPAAYLPEASDAHGRTPDPGGTLPDPPPKQPHPLNPAVQVSVRTTHPYRAAVRPPMMNGRAIPIAEHACVESDSLPPFRTKV